MNNNLSLIRLSPASPRKAFDCGDPDLNEFFHKDSIDYAVQLLAVTYALETENETTAFFSVLNDRIHREAVAKAAFRKIRKNIPKQKQLNSYPAVKVGRFAVSEKYKRQRIGTELMDFIKGFFIDLNNTGCRFITVDAYPQAVAFYLNNGFKPLVSEIEEGQNLPMYFDLMPMARRLR